MGRMSNGYVLAQSFSTIPIVMGSLNCTVLFPYPRRNRVVCIRPRTKTMGRALRLFFFYVSSLACTDGHSFQSLVYVTSDQYLDASALVPCDALVLSRPELADEGPHGQECSFAVLYRWRQ